MVNVFSRRVVRQQVDPFWQMFGVTPREGVEQSLGSGVIVRADGVIVTNHHVVEGGQEIHAFQLRVEREYMPGVVDLLRLLKEIRRDIGFVDAVAADQLVERG